jgi:hypothetical protein
MCFVRWPEAFHETSCDRGGPGVGIYLYLNFDLREGGNRKDL